VQYEEEKEQAVHVLKENDDKFEELNKTRQENEKIIHDELKKHDQIASKIEEC
jgi:hypothetical protein